MSDKSAIAAALLVLSSAGVAEARSVSVPRAGVDFLDAGAVDGFHRDLAEAADRACRSNERMTLASRQAVRECRIEALDRSVKQANTPTLSVLHAELAPALRINPERPQLDVGTLAEVAAVAETMRAEAAPAVVASLQ